MIQYIITENAAAYRAAKKLCFFGPGELQYLKKTNDQQAIYVGKAHLALQAERKSTETHKTLQHSITAIQYNTIQGIINRTL